MRRLCGTTNNWVRGVRVSTMVSILRPQNSLAVGNLRGLWMKVSRLAFSLLMLIAFAVFASDSPDTREITDPNSLTSQTELGAGPVPIDDLFFTRGIIGPSWSPNGREIAFSTNITG